ncbi:C39 family peptidase [Actinoplanes sp. L3-i22]|uniref:C39 family peptidase n=1 Tax=Actinoplanes sp. L3-i22 TaxID=2836373 RepID=UPI001C77EAAD|nr:C39 family peptidase [Actinoplanes sp. L3-i22]BCY08544.1 membrane protein [Actinoplanes sp. L3-i22]
MKVSTRTGPTASYREWTAAELSSGDGYGVRLDAPDGVEDGEDFLHWTSALISPGFAVGELVPSWAAHTPGSSRLRVEARGVATGGTLTRWYNLGHWSEHERTSITGQGDQDGRVDTDTLIAAGDGWQSVQMRITLLRPHGSKEIPVLHRAGLLMSRASNSASPPTRVPLPGASFSRTLSEAPHSGAVAQESSADDSGRAHGVVLDVPAYAQYLHADHGGRGWCSPTSIAMVLDFWGVGPGPEELLDLPADHPDPQVDHAAAHVHDPAYGFGNWSFNVAHAARRGLIAFVTRLGSLTEAEKFIAAGVPLILSSNGHVVVLAGFTTGGDPVLNDPAANADADVRRTVPRSDFEHSWLSTSRGICYVLHPPTVARPHQSDEQTNW